MGSSEEKLKRARLEQEVKESQLRFKKASREMAISNYRTMLNEIVKQPNVHWQFIRNRIVSDIQVRIWNNRWENTAFRDVERVLL